MNESGKSYAVNKNSQSEQALDRLGICVKNALTALTSLQSDETGQTDPVKVVRVWRNLKEEVLRIVGSLPPEHEILYRMRSFADHLGVIRRLPDSLNLLIQMHCEIDPSRGTTRSD